MCSGGDSVKQVLAVVGPTASGKTDLAVSIARRVSGEIIIADSMQVYRGMPIATAAVTTAEMQGVPHHLLSFLEPDAPFSVASYVQLASEAAHAILQRGNVPIFCGGTGLFLDALFQNLQFVPQEENSRLRDNLFARAQREGPERLFQELMEIDPAAAAKIHPNNVKRVVRALEVWYSTGVPFSEQAERARSVPGQWAPYWIGLNYQDRAVLYERINLRVDHMMEAGLLDEARHMMERTDAATCMQAIGHKELIPCLKGEMPLETAVEELKKKTRNYAKRQLTWFRRNKAIHWFYPDVQPDYVRAAADAALAFLKGAE